MTHRSRSLIVHFAALVAVSLIAGCVEESSTPPPNPPAAQEVPPDNPTPLATVKLALGTCNVTDECLSISLTDYGFSSELDACVARECVVNAAGDGNTCQFSFTAECLEAAPEVTVECLTALDCEDDGNFCNGAPVCNAGVCETTAPPCPADDGLFCNGTASCDEETDTCVEPTPPCPADDGNFCNGVESCDELTDTCSIPVDPCADDLYCNGSEVCNEVLDSCEAGTNPCPDDGNACNGTESCDELTDACVAGTPLTCDDGNVCTDDGSCDPASGCPEPVNNTSACDDGDACTTGDVCDAGSCLPGTPLSCDDGNVCTDDGSCDPASGCPEPVNNTSACDDGDACTTGDVCDAGSCSSGLPMDCTDLDDPDACVLGTCEGGACTTGPASDGASCNDGDNCTVGDVCATGACTGGTPMDCSDLDDPGSCAAGLCADGICVTGPADDGVVCGDAGECTSALTCVAGDCLGGGAPINEGGACDDGWACSTSSFCDAGDCVSNEPDNTFCVAEPVDPTALYFCAAGYTNSITPAIMSHEAVDEDGCVTCYSATDPQCVTVFGDFLEILLSEELGPYDFIIRATGNQLAYDVSVGCTDPTTTLGYRLEQFAPASCTVNEAPGTCWVGSISTTCEGTPWYGPLTGSLETVPSWVGPGVVPFYSVQLGTDVWPVQPYVNGPAFYGHPFSPAP